MVVVLLVKVIKHGVDVHKLQQPVPSLLLHIAIIMMIIIVIVVV